MYSRADKCLIRTELKIIAAQTLQEEPHQYWVLQEPFNSSSNEKVNSGFATQVLAKLGDLD